MSDETTTTATNEPPQPFDVGAAMDQIEAILRAIGNANFEREGDRIRWTMVTGYSFSVIVTAEMFDMHGKAIDRASVSATARGVGKPPTHAEIVRALHASAMKRAREYTRAFASAVGA